jgi:hypothetical protein
MNAVADAAKSVETPRAAATAQPRILSADADGSTEARPLAVTKHVARDERHVRAGNNNYGDRNTDECEQSIVQGPRGLEAYRSQTLTPIDRRMLCALQFLRESKTPIL